MDGRLLVATQLSSLFPPAHAVCITVTTMRQNTPLPQAASDSDPQPEHAIHSAIMHTPTTGTILLRVLHGGLILELLSLSTDIAPVRFVFPSAILPQPAIFLWQSDQLHVIAVTVTGSLYRLVIDIADGLQLWRNHVDSISFREYLIKNYSGILDGLVHVQGTHCVAVGFTNGSLLRFDADLGDETDEWTESVFHQHGSFLSTLTSFLTPSAAEASEIIAMATHPWPTDLGYIWTLSRDRVLRFWKPKLGCAAMKALNAGPGSPGPGGSQPNVFLGPERRTLLRVFSQPGEDDHLYVLAFLPWPSGGVFQLLDTHSDHIQEVGIIACSKSSAQCQLQDFMVLDGVLYVLWERQGQSLVEKTIVDMSRVSGDDELQTNIWQSASYAPEPELTPAYLEEVLLSPGSMSDRFFEVIMRPGIFSALTLRTSIEQYTDACLSLPGPPPPPLQKTYSTLGENIASVVGCTVNLNPDPKTGALQHAKYWIALKRDWEGFIARCREVERSARWPLVLGARDQGEIILVERERVGSLVVQDLPINLWRSVNQPHPVIPQSYELLGILWALRAELGSHVTLDLENRLFDILHQEIAFPFVDILRDQSERARFREDLEDSFVSWVDGRLERIPDLDAAVHTILDAVGGIDPVIKREEEDEEALLLPQAISDWSRALTAAYVVTSANARYDLCLSLILLFYFLPSLDGWTSPTLAEVFAVFRGVAALRFVARQPASLTTRVPAAEISATDDVVSLMRNMQMSHSSSYSRPTISLIHRLLVSSGESSYALPGAAFRFLDATGLLQSVSPASATSHEVYFCERLRLLGYYDAAREMLSWLPRTPGVTYVLARLWLNIGRADDAALLMEKIAGSFGPEKALSFENQVALAKVLPNEELFQDPSSFYLHAAMLFKSHSLTYQEVLFTQLAISASPSDVDTSALWYTVVKGYTDLGMYDDSYAAWVASPYERQKRESLSQLVYRMCEDGAVAELTGFNFAGFADEVEECLSFKARNVDPRSQPNYSRILYSWYTMRGDYRNAALAMYQRARKLHDLMLSNPQLVTAIADDELEAYLLAMNSLSLVDPKNAWILIPGTLNTQLSPRRKFTTHIPESKYGLGKYDAELIRPADIEHNYILLTAQLDLIRTDPSLLSAPEFLLPATSIVLRLSLSNRFDYALSTARSLGVDMSDLFTHLTTQCLRLSRDEEAVLQEECAWLLTDTSSSWSGSPADRGWRYLRRALEQYDGPEADYGYTKVAFETILTFQRSPPPPWLIRSLEAQHPEFLIRSSLRFEYYDRAVEYSLSMIRKTNDQLARDPPKTAGASWLPYALIDQVLAVTAPHEKELPGVPQLRMEVSARVKRTQQLSSQLSAKK